MINNLSVGHILISKNLLFFLLKLIILFLDQLKVKLKVFKIRNYNCLMYQIETTNFMYNCVYESEKYVYC